MVYLQNDDSCKVKAQRLHSFSNFRVQITQLIYQVLNSINKYVFITRLLRTTELQ